MNVWIVGLLVFTVFLAGCDIELGHDDHDHDEDGVQDHDAEDHDDAVEEVQAEEESPDTNQPPLV